MRYIAHVLVVDDDERLRSLLKKYLRENGYFVSLASEPKEADEALESLAVDIMILDLMMPNETGTDYIKRLKQNPNTSNLPVIMLTAMGEVEDRIAGLLVGADDYLAKPFEPKELILRIEKLLKWSTASKKDVSKEVVKFGDYAFDIYRLTLKKNDASIYLTSTEINLMKILSVNIGKVVLREEVAAAIGGSERLADVQIARLRKKIEINPKNPEFIHTVRGGGYTLRQ